MNKIFEKIFNHNAILRDIHRQDHFRAYIRLGCDENFYFSSYDNKIAVLEYGCGIFERMKTVDGGLLYIYSELIRFSDVAEMVIIENP